MGVELTDLTDRERLQAQLRRDGGRLDPVPDGPKLECFSALELAQALESELNRAASVGHTKIRLDMTFDDAAKLASFLRRAVLLGT